MLTFFSIVSNAQNNYNTLWDEVHRFELLEQPKSALKVVTKIHKTAKSKNNSPQIIKALLYKSKFALILEEDAQFSIVNEFKKHINNASNTTVTKSVLQNILANMYWQYFKKNRWKFYQRTKTNTKVDKNDFRRWDLETLFTEIHLQFQNSLASKNDLQKTSLQDFQVLIKTTGNSEKYRPTLYDFLAHNALDFYTTSETGITKPTYKFTLKSPDYISDAVTFSSLTLKSKDILSLEFNSLKIYQNLIQFHLSNNNTNALIDVDLQRLAFVKSKATFTNKDQLYLETLLTSEKKHQSHEASGLYSFEIANYYFNQAKTYSKVKNQHFQFKHKEALEICDAIIKKFPESFAAQKSKLLIEKIKAKKITITSEEYIPINSFSRILINYKNIDRLYFSIYEVDQQKRTQMNRLFLAKEKIDFINSLKKTIGWSYDLPNKNDHQNHTNEVIIPRQKQGSYLIVASLQKELNPKEIFGFTSFQVSNLSLINRNEAGNTSVYQVLNRNTGKPIEKALVNFRNEKRRRGRSINISFTTDKNGEIQYNPKQYYGNVTAQIKHQEDEITIDNLTLRTSYNNTNLPQKQVASFIFTDRSIYRPGQTVYFKSISLEKLKNNSTLLVNTPIEVTLKDVSNIPVKTLQLKTNEFGSVAGEFILPTSGLTGSFQIVTTINGRRSYQYISVEEYKRPKFETNFKPITTSFKLYDSITVTGFAQSYAGTAITDAKVTYRVHRKVQYPRWFYWYRPVFNYSESQEISFGEMNTNDKGEFEITFKALPDENIAKDQFPIFNYEITADVTDLNGETRSSSTLVKVGYHSLIATIDINESINKQQKEHSFTIDTKNLNNEFVPASGEIKIYKLKAPKYPLRSRPWASPDYQTISKKEFQEKFPHDPYTDENNRIHWDKEALVFTTQFNTEKDKKISLKKIKKWASGSYSIELTSKDKFGQKVSDKAYFSVYGNKEKLPIDNKLFDITTDKESYTVGETAKVTVNTNSDDVTVMLFVEKQHKVINSYYIDLAKNSETIEIPIDKDDLGGFAINYHFVNYNDFKNGGLTIAVPYPKTDLEITTKTFRDKLQPGAKETWSFTVKGVQKEKVTAEFLAGMYDASLDQFQPHHWNFSPIDKPTYYTSSSSSSRGFSTTRFAFQNLPQNFYTKYPQLRYSQMQWFGFSFDNNRWTNDKYLSNLSFQRTTFDGTISGIIKDSNSIAVPFANITIKGTRFGTTTDENGNFTVKVNKNDVLIFSFLGYKTIERKVKNFKKLEVVLEEDENALDEVVVVGYGTTRRKSITASAVQKLEVQAPGIQSRDLANSNLAPKEKYALEDDADWSSKNSEKKYDQEERTLPNIKARTNFQETAFFYPKLRTDKNGDISFDFTVPEALTTWNLKLLTHNKKLHHSQKTLTTVTQKELMVMPNAPRFLREKDQITLSAKISNLTDKTLTGISQLILTNAITGKTIDAELQNTSSQKNFTVTAKGNTNVSWNLMIPENIQAVEYKIVAQSGSFSDGEQNVLPVLSNRMLVTETLPMWVRSNQTKTFTLQKLKNNTSPTLKHHQLSLEVTSNPVWQAVQALPYLMEYPHECAEQTFSRYYANTLASFIANSNPKIQSVFQQWKNSDALLSNLEKNPELKSLIIQETPWLRDAQSETEQKKRIGLLFDLNKMQQEQISAINKLQSIQMSTGGFPWFKGANYPSVTITNHIATGFGHLKKLGIATYDETTKRILKRALQFLDESITDKHSWLLKNAIRAKKSSGKKGYDEFLAKKHIGYYELQYLYMRSFFEEIKTSKSTQKAIDYYLQQAGTYWNDFNLYGKGLNALIQFRNNQKNKADLILKSLEENSITSDELGMYWKENKAGWYWHQAPVETQALLIEAFAEIKNDTKTIDNLKIWLLKNKQVNSWKTTKSTTQAIYALLFQGTNWLSSSELVNVTVGDTTIDPSTLEDTKIEAGTGYYKTSWKGSDISSNKATVTLTKNDAGIAWGGLYWQYFEDLDKITHAKTPLALTKKLFKKTNSNTGKQLIEVTNTDVQVGDLITVRVTLKADRDMEFIHMKDMRASAFEPADVLSQYKWQDGLGYYQSTKDAATHFFFDRLPKGVYVFEYDVRANNKGNFSNGITTIQSMYAPEFSSHSKGTRIQIK